MDPVRPTGHIKPTDHFVKVVRLSFPCCACDFITQINRYTPKPPLEPEDLTDYFVSPICVCDVDTGIHTRAREWKLCVLNKQKICTVI